MGSLNIPVLKTPEDVLAHKGKAPAPIKPASAPPPAPPPAPAPAPAPEQSVEEVAAGLVSQYKKDELVQMCKDAGLEAEGTKADLAQALAEAYAK